MSVKTANSSCVFFWGACRDKDNIHKGCLSQWQSCAFSVEGIQYQSAEQFMMAEKARLFGDDDALRKIMSSKAPRNMKAIGRGVRGFDAKAWDENKFEVVVRGNMAKFSQNPALMAFLIGTGDATLVEASPDDCVWGVGLKESDRKILDPGEWKGENLLGKALMKVRDALAKQKEAKAVVKEYAAQSAAGQSSIVDILALRAHYARQEAWRGLSCQQRKRKAEVVEKPVIWDIVGPATDRKYVESLKASVASSRQYVDGKAERRVEIVDPKAVEEFVRLYKPYVFGVLKTHCYFELKNGKLVNGHIDAEDVFNEVVIRFLRNKELKNLNLFKAGAGKTPFRNYLNVVVQCAFNTMVEKDLVEEVGPDGKPVLVPKKDKKGLPIFETDEKGVVKMDAEGHPVFKMRPKRISRHVAIEHIGNLAWGEHMPKMWAPVPSNKHLQELLLDILTIAYVSVHERKEYRKGWAYDAMAAIFERGEDSKAVAERLKADGMINRVNTFEAAKSRFAEKWHAAWMNLYKSLFKSKSGRMVQDDFLAELWREAKARLGKSKKVASLRAGIAEWAFDYAERALRKGAEKHAHHRY